jgi:exonuclease III
MKIFSWNCRGLGNPRTVRELRRWVKNKRPEVVFIMETKMQSTKLDPIRSKLGFQNVFGVDSCGKSGGLALFWQGEVKLEIQNYSWRHINAIVSGEGSTPWKLSGFYGHPDVRKRREAWGLMRTLATFQPEAWMLIGDFNEIVELSEKQGGGNRPRSQMEAFQRVITECGLSDLGCKGLKYTWSNCQEEGSFVRERLDRGMANAEWCSLFPGAEISAEAGECSDHCPLILSTSKVLQNQYKKRGFIYDATWSKETVCRDIIKKVWRVKGRFPNTWTNVKQKLHECKKELSRWKKKSRCSFGT